MNSEPSFDEQLARIKADKARVYAEFGNVVTEEAIQPEQDKANGYHEPVAPTEAEDGVYESEEAYAARVKQSAFERAEKEALNPEEPEPEPGQENRNHPEQDTGQFNRTDVGNAKRLVALFGDRLRYVTEWGWMWYDGVRWLAVDDVLVQGLAKQTLVAMEKEAIELKKSSDKNTQEAGNRLGQWAFNSEFGHHVGDMVKLARDEVQARVDDFNTNPWLFNALDVTIDLRTGKFHAHDPKDMITKVAGVALGQQVTEFDDTLFYRFLHEVFDNNEAMIRYVQEVFGYALTDVIRDEHFWLANGPGGNGKTVLYETTAEAMGNYAAIGRVEMIVDHGKLPRKDFDLATMVGARRVTFNETDQGQKLNESLIKELSGGDGTMAEAKFHPPFPFHPHFKMHLRTNHLPKVEDISVSLWRRFRVIPFKHCWSDQPGCSKPDLQLQDKLKAELPTVLRWLVTGAIAWYNTGLHEPEAVKLATENYQGDNDPIEAFLIDRTRHAAATVRSKGQDLFSIYTDWYEGPFDEKLSPQEFGKLLTDKGYHSKRSNGATYYYGIERNDVETREEKRRREYAEKRELGVFNPDAPEFDPEDDSDPE